MRTRYELTLHIPTGTEKCRLINSFYYLHQYLKAGGFFFKVWPVPKVSDPRATFEIP